MTDYLAIANKIIDTYESNLYTLLPRYQGHWALRRFRSTNDPKYILASFIDFQFRTLKAFPLLVNINDESYIKEVSSKMLANYKPNSERKANRLETYQKDPTILFYAKVIEYLFLAKCYGFDSHPDFEKEFRNAISHLKKVKMEDIIFQNSLAQSHPSAIANRAFYLEYIGVGDWREHAMELTKEVWLKQKPDRDSQYQLKIYGLTHLIIAASYYYQQFVEDSPKLSWIFEFFEKNIEEIKVRTTADILAEVGLCFKLCKKDSFVVEEVKKEIAGSFNESLGIVPREAGDFDLGKAEHRNILAVFLLSGFDNLYQGPNLVEFLQANKKSVVFPTTLYHTSFTEETEDD